MDICVYIYISISLSLPLSLSLYIYTYIMYYVYIQASQLDEHGALLDKKASREEVGRKVDIGPFEELFGLSVWCVYMFICRYICLYVRSTLARLRSSLACRYGVYICIFRCI